MSSTVRSNAVVAVGPAVSVESPRLLSLDAYRGLIMIALAFNGFGLAKTATERLKTYPDSAFWQTVQQQFSHAEWVGCAFWDLIQPSFMFMVGVSMAYSYVKRQARGDSEAQLFIHAFVRSLVLILLGVFLSSTGSESTNWTFMNVLSQIGLGYPFLFLMWRRPRWMQALVVLLLLLATWLGYESYRTPGIDMEAGNPAVGVSAEWAQQHLGGLDPQWHKNANLGHAADLVFLNWFPRGATFAFNAGGYQTLNFIPSLATMLIGLICGEVLRCDWRENRRLLVLAGLGASALVSGWILTQLGIPLIKRIWTPSWALFSSGWCCLILAVLYGIIDVAGWRRWSFFLVVVGMNSIAIYVMGQLLRGWTLGQLKIHFGRTWPDALGPDFVPMLSDTAVGLVFWLVCWWMARQKIFIRI